jgi:hypothetical protein
MVAATIAHATHQANLNACGATLGAISPKSGAAMTTIAATSAASDNLLSMLLSQLGSAASAPSTSKSSSGGSATNASADAGATTIDLSDAAKTLLQQAGANQADAVNVPASFDDMVQQKTDAFASSLSQALTAMNIPQDQPLHLTIDSSGTIHADGPYKDKIEKMFRDNPELAKQAKEVATLNALRATTEALRLYNKELRTATTKEQRDAASDRYTMRAMTIQTLSGNLTLAGGQVTSAAMDYANALSPTDTAQAA